MGVSPVQQAVIMMMILMSFDILPLMLYIFFIRTHTNSFWVVPNYHVISDDWGILIRYQCCTLTSYYAAVHINYWLFVREFKWLLTTSLCTVLWIFLMYILKKIY